MRTIVIILIVTLCLGIANSDSSESKPRQKRAWIIDSFTIEEEYPGPYPYTLGKIHVERDYRVAFELQGNGVDEDPKGLLQIDKAKGIISVLGKVDYEKHQVLKLTFEARNMSNQEVDTRLGVEITILDINDHPPKFQRNVYETDVEESKEQGTYVITVVATDDDRPGSPNSTIQYRMVSVTPDTPNTEFYIQDSGRISFKGCLDYEEAQKYTIVVEAKDGGEVKQLSSTSTVIINVLDKNNHMPVITGRSGTGRVKERESGLAILRVHTTDEDSKGSAAWRAKYTISGDKGEHFQIRTDPETNDGILTVAKPLDYEEGSERHLSVTVENEEPYFSCQVKRKTSTEKWVLNNIRADTGKGGLPIPVSVNITITVEDVNDPPEFKPTQKDVMVDEDIMTGYLLETFTSVDPDGGPTSEIEYVKGDDPAGWFHVDPKNCQITTVKTLDRESPYVVNGTYTVTIYSIDKGNPPMTSTATLTIHLSDKNDNLPQLHMNTISMCLSDESTMTNITAYDMDDAPFSGPFRFELLGDVKGKWSLDSNYGTTVNLIKKGTVYSGHHQLQVKIYDQQGHYSLQNISVIVCDCSIGTSCLVRGAPSSNVNSNAIGIVIASLLLLLGCLMLVFLLTCGREKFDFPFSNNSGDVLLTSNIEKPGTDCKVPDNSDRLLPLQVDHHQTDVCQSLYGQNATMQYASTFQQVGNQTSGYQNLYQNREEQGYHLYGGTNSMYKRMTMQHTKSMTDRYQYKALTLGGKHSFSKGGAFLLRKEAITSLIYQRLSSIQTLGQELCDYDPKVYADEGDVATQSELDSISMDEEEFAPDDFLNLGPRFITLATICSPKPALH
ncbi:hypothetical protein AGOR_G00157960 [Albula goreensis]|uniref:Cadherin domain-containing protein n=1 Tax=Albula goreensis TaxID=1534307 RepID=A0A8T3D2S7_9TELE|nr:hypothetical protein AGOR_G00157960 [Albula goreensis]